MKDLLVIGGGPAGLMAAYTAAKKGLSVTLVEKKSELNINRACSAMLVLDEGYEGETIRFEDDRIVFTKSGFEVPYTGKKIPIIHNYLFSPKGHRVAFEYDDLRPTAMKIDKLELLNILLKQCEEAGVEILMDTQALDGSDNGNSISLNVLNGSNKYVIEARKLVIAEGVNRRITEAFGINKGYQAMGVPLTVQYTLEGTVNIPHNSWSQYYGNCYHPLAEVMFGESTYSEDAIECSVVGMGQYKPETFFENLRKEGSPLYENLKDAKVFVKRGCSCKNFLAISKPYAGNAVAIGDSAAHIETVIQGALMCGYHAANAVADELDGKNGFEVYTKWWNEAFEFNCEDQMALLKMYGALSIKRTLADDEIDYVFALLENEKHCGHFNQYEVPKNFWTDVLRHDDLIRSDRPELYEKLSVIRSYKEQGKF